MDYYKNIEQNNISERYMTLNKIILMN